MCWPIKRRVQNIALFSPHCGSITNRAEQVAEPVFRESGQSGAKQRSTKHTRPHTQLQLRCLHGLTEIDGENTIEGLDPSTNQLLGLTTFPTPNPSALLVSRYLVIVSDACSLQKGNLYLHRGPSVVRYLFSRFVSDDVVREGRIFCGLRALREGPNLQQTLCHFTLCPTKVLFEVCSLD